MLFGYYVCMYCRGEYVLSTPGCLSVRAPTGYFIFISGGPRPYASNIIRSQPSAVEPEKPSLLC